VSSRPLHDRELTVQGQTLRYTSWLRGVPHTVIYVDDRPDKKWMGHGWDVEQASVFPRRTNVNFAHVNRRPNGCASAISLYARLRADARLRHGRVLHCGRQRSQRKDRAERGNQIELAPDIYWRRTTKFT
jgi:hypothetical protein